MTLSFGICNRGMRNDGEIRILNLIERVSQRFISNRILDDRFVLTMRHPSNGHWIRKITAIPITSE